MSKLSRRSLVTTAATFPALAAVMPDAPVFGLASDRKVVSDAKLYAQANADAELAASIVWPDLGEPANWPEDDQDEKSLEKLGEIDFPGIPEFLSEGVGPGTPEFRKQLEAYFRTIARASRHAIMVLGPSRAKLVDALTEAKGEEEEALLHVLHRGCEDLVRLARLCQAAEVRVSIASTLRDMIADGELSRDALTDGEASDTDEEDGESEEVVS
jgi:hypothetical protein